MEYISFPALLKKKERLIEERKQFFRKYFCREESELMQMFDTADREAWEVNKQALHEATILIEGYRKECKERGINCI